MELQPPAICVSICEETIDALEKAIDRARPLANIIEFRLDCIDPFQIGDNFSRLDHLFANSSTPIIITYRPAEQGGRRALDIKTRLIFWLFNWPPHAAFLDIEFDIARNAHAFDYGRKPDWSRVICSYHDFVGIPENLAQLYANMATTPAGILKIAVRADDAIDCLPVFRLLERARSEGRQMIAIAMGDAGIATRILGPSRGGFLTYASLDNQTAIAPGQLTVEELRSLYRIEKINGTTQIMGLVGMPVTHSVSPQMHNAAFEAAGVNGVYIPFPVRDIASFVKRMIHPRTREIDWNIRGLSVTAPHKNAIMTCLDWIEPAAIEIGAVNTIVVEEDALHGYNTDASAFIQTISKDLGELPEARCAVIGSGGAARAVVWGLRQARAEVTVYARDEIKAAALARSFQVTSQPLPDARFGEFDLVVNATPLGTSGPLVNQTPATADQLRGARLACDLVYNPQETRFLREARAGGCKTLGGMPMLVKQAAEQFEFWTRVPAPENVMLKAALDALKEGQK